MKTKIIFILLFCSILFFGCSYIDYPEGFVILINFPQEIIDVEKKQINSKDELVDYVNSIVPSYFYEGVEYKDYKNYKMQFDLERGYTDKQQIIYLNPLSDNKKVLSKNIYESGMPIVIDNSRRIGFYNDHSYKNSGYLSKQPVILIKGKTEWADSSYKGFTILPVCDFDCNNLDFTYTIREVGAK
ncbi:MAG: hypothetical protein LBH98_04110 [Chitinispirillales bacterium]|jgi:hypothetical protein|nr:hypothetical protein [Chitinispirillales bacterium]